MTLFLYNFLFLFWLNFFTILFRPHFFQFDLFVFLQFLESRTFFDISIVHQTDLFVSLSEIKQSRLAFNQSSDEVSVKLFIFVAESNINLSNVSGDPSCICEHFKLVAVIIPIRDIFLFCNKIRQYILEHFLLK